MAPPTQSSDGRRKSGGKPSLVVTLSVPSDQLRELFDDEPTKEESPAAASEPKDIVETKESPDTPAAAANGSGDAPSDSNVATPAAEGTPASSAMGPPADGPGPKKKGVKRSAAGTTVDGVPKVRGKPGPKKKPRL